MEDWELDRIYVWIRAASVYEKNNGVKFLIDLNDKLLFNLILKDNKWSCVLNQEISVQYSKEQIKTLENKIESLKSNQNEILEFPKLEKPEIENIKKAKLEIQENKAVSNKMEYNRIIYEEPTNFGIKWLESLEIKINELSRVGF